MRGTPPASSWNSSIQWLRAPSRKVGTSYSGYVDSDTGGGVLDYRFSGRRLSLFEPSTVSRSPLMIRLVAVDPGDPDTVVLSAAPGPHVAYSPRGAEAYLYRKRAGDEFASAMAGLPDGAGTVARRLLSVPDEPGVFYAASNHGLFRSSDAGASWNALEIPWPEGVFNYGVDAFLVIPAS